MNTRVSVHDRQVLKSKINPQMQKERTLGMGYPGGGAWKVKDCMS